MEKMDFILAELTRVNRQLQKQVRPAELLGSRLDLGG